MENISRKIIGAVSIAVIVLFFFFSGYVYLLMFKELKQTSEKLGSAALNHLRYSSFLEDKIKSLKIGNANLSSWLASEQIKNEFFAQQISGIQGTVNTLEKLSKTDEELLQKYSKVYFLNEHYVPLNLSVIDKKYTYNQDEVYQIHSNVQAYLDKILDAAQNDNVSVEIVSAYRSFGAQTSLKLGYTYTYGSGANQFSADQGYSEHQLGTTVDLTTTDSVPFSKFETTQAYQWLQNNAHKYGFILSYPKNNQYYLFEPWHWRFVGVSLAAKLHDNNQYFYDLDQREIDSYLVSIFD